MATVPVELPKAGIRAMETLEQRFQNRFLETESFLSVGLDPEWEKLPVSFQREGGLFDFCKEIVDATFEHALAFKPNIAFFERFGHRGIQEFERIVEYIGKTYPSIIRIADAKRGDLYNTSKEYAKYYFDSLGVDALTVNPYMGYDSLLPYVENERGNVFILSLTSNPSAPEFQNWVDPSQEFSPGYLHLGVARMAERMNREFPGRIGIVAGGTRPSELEKIRALYPELLFLIPGYGAQGGDLREIILAAGLRSIINSSRGIHFLGADSDFAKQAALKAEEIHREMKHWIRLLESNKRQGSS